MTSMPVHSNTIPGTIPERSNTILAGKERKGVERKGKDISDPDGSPVPAVSELPPKEPKPPPENAAASLRLSWAFYVLRKRAEGDEYFDPYGDKHLGQCKQIVEKKANGNTEEATRRANNLFEYWKQKPDYWKLTPGDLLSKWESLNKGPEDKSGSATAAAMDAAR